MSHARGFEILDAQIGVWAAHDARYPWDEAALARATSNGGIEGRVFAHKLARTNSIEQTLASMEAVGVDAAILNHSSQYGWDLSYVLDAARRYPEIFASTPRADHRAPDIDEQMATWRDQPGVVGARVILLTDANVAELRAGGYEAIFSAAERHSVALTVFCPGVIAEVGAVARAHPDLQIVIDHFGLPQPPLMQPDPEPFQALPALLALAALPNVAVKFSGAPTLSRRPYPFVDLWPHLHRVVDAFGPERLIWAADYPRVDDHDYGQALGYLLYTNELSDSEKALILGGSARQVFRWTRVAQVAA